MDGFTENPRLVTLSTAKNTKLVSLTTYYKLEVISGTKKADIQKALTKYLVNEEIVAEEGKESLPDLKLRKLE